MKHKILIIVVLFLSFFGASAQYDPTRVLEPVRGDGYRWKKGAFDFLMRAPNNRPSNYGAEASGAIIFNTSTLSWEGWDGTQYVPLGGSNSSWDILGNSGTVAGTNFLGTTDNVPLEFRVNNVRSGLINIANTQTYFGYGAGLTNSANSVSFFGAGAGKNNVGASNSFFGANAGFGNTNAGGANVGIGVNALYETTGQGNVAVGNGAGFQITFNRTISLGSGAVPTASNQFAVDPDINELYIPGIPTGAGYVLTDLAGDGHLTLQANAAGINIYNSDGSISETRTVTIQDNVDEDAFLLFQANDLTSNLQDAQFSISKQGMNMQYSNGLTGFTNIIRADYLGANIQSSNSTTSAFFGISLTDAAGVVQDDTPDQHGLVYQTDYSATFIDRSLVDKGYVDNIFGFLTLQTITDNGYITTNPLVVSDNLISSFGNGGLSGISLHPGGTGEGGYIQWHGASGVVTQVQSTNVTGTNVLELPYSDGHTLAVSVNGTFADPVTGDITVSVGGSGWGVTGNSGLTGGTNFIGTTDNVDVWFKRDGDFAGIIGTGNTTLGLNAGVTGKTSNIGMTSFGANSLFFATGTSNAAFGGSAGSAVTTGQRNTLLGSGAGGTITTGSFNTFVGYLADGDDVARSNSIAIGYGAVATADQQLAFTTNVNQMSLPGFTTGAGYVLTDVSGNGILTLEPGGGGGSLTDGQGTTANGTAVDLGGVISGAVVISSSTYTSGLFGVTPIGDVFIGDIDNTVNGTYIHIDDVVGEKITLSSHNLAADGNNAVLNYSAGVKFQDDNGIGLFDGSGGNYNFLSASDQGLTYDLTATGGQIAVFTFDVMTANRSYTLPDASGTFALTSDLSSYLTTSSAASTYVPQTRTINGNALSSNVTISTITGNAGSATVLQTARTIGLSGDATATGISFDGSSNIALTVNVGKLNGTTLSSLATGLLKNTTTTGVPSIAVAGTDYVAPGGALGTPSSGTLTNATGLPISSGVSGLGSNVATFLATPSSANFFAAITDETGSGVAVGGTTPTFTTNITTPVVIGGTGTGSTLTLQTTSGVGAAGIAMNFKGGNNGATTLATVTNAGAWDFQSGSITTTGNLSVNSTIQLGASRVGASSQFYWNGRSQIFSSADGIIYFTNAASTGFTGLSLGGTTSSFPQVRVNGTGIDFKLADNSAFTGTQDLYNRFGSGTPESNVTAPVGAVYHRTDGGAVTSFYVKESGSGNTGWVAK